MHVAAGKWAERKGVGILRCALLLCLSCVSDHGQIGFCCLGARMAVVTHADQEQSGVGWLLLLLAVADLETLGNERMLPKQRCKQCGSMWPSLANDRPDNGKKVVCQVSSAFQFE